MGNQPKPSTMKVRGCVLVLVSLQTQNITVLGFLKVQSRQGLSTAHYAVIVYGASALVLLSLPYFLKTGYISYPLIVYFYLLLMAILSQVIGQTGLNWSLRWISPVIVTLAVMFEPIFLAILAYLFFREVPSLLVFIGGTILLFGVAIAAINSKYIFL
ncbi:EamA family transporter [Scytonema sp. UIC 10036]|uniref:DMT family transporter n=1 Tax=Scytonema sp. UIC 10036 TaxID=2304196 RepID=UPI0012DA5FE2|nr:DMT family transporter [Scytonema sp. UIC 10036]MUG94779.1 EamA family transporter [Scytonema sp. UIC 10036]